ncbi:acyl-CoA thioesterase domain-containing protein [Streptomyces noursei]|uniref:acyl-CoA thioesterase domain-containing protein n=1 Tax=Streptomyces noursei TaxID=1971 RepID=UPI0016768D7B|nr:acyl-CoA thioesterase domain-containing protein [Streptomyces noursei]MCZ1014862.1 thioesterase family protein [Streptomyces noursei]GGX53247.1 hypothetical protein GCM10010341_88150 [Streptomyces noursei]
MNPDIDTLIDTLSKYRDAERAELEIGSPWYCSSNWVFSGMIAAVSAATASARYAGAMLESCDTVFLNPTRAGTLTVLTRTLRSGRQGPVLEVSITQGGRTNAVSTLRVAHSKARKATIAPPHGWHRTGPAACRDISFVAEHVPILGLFEERAEGYPETWDAPRPGITSVESWARVRELRNKSTVLESQLYDMLLLDCHVFQPLHFDPRTEEAISEDFHMEWLAPAAPDEWTHVHTESALGGNDAAIVHGELRTSEGALRAIGSCRGRVLFREGIE